MWAKRHFNGFLRWVLTTLLSIIFPFATIKNPDGSQQQQESYRAVPVPSVINAAEPDNEVHENVGEKNEGDENEDADYDRNSKGSKAWGQEIHEMLQMQERTVLFS